MSLPSLPVSTAGQEQQVPANNDFQSILSGLTGGAANSLALGATTAYNQNLQDRLLSAAVDNLNNFAQTVQAQGNPDLLQYINDNINLAKQGQISPAQMLSAVQQKSQMFGVKVPQNFTDATNQALAQEGQVAKQGYTPVERAAIQNALQGVISQQRGEQGAIAAAQQARGQYGGGQALDQEQEALQGAINNASAVGNQTEANAYTRALQALQAQGSLGLGAGAQSFSQNAAVATAQDAINSLNTQLQQQANATNQSANQQAILQTSAQQQQRDLANQQAQLALNQQKSGAVNQTVQNLQGRENIAGGALANAGKNAAGVLPSVYNNTQTGVAGIASNLLGPNGAVANGVGNLARQGVGALTGGGGGGGVIGPGTAAAARLAGGSGGSTVLDATGYSPPAVDNSIFAQNDPNTGLPTGVQPVDTSGAISDYSSNYTPPPIDTSSLDTSDFSSGLTDSFPSYMTFAKGGEARGFDFYDGGHVKGPGSETSDSIPALLSNHEFVVNAESAKKYKPLVEAINDGDHESILDSLLPLIAPEHHEIQIVVTPKGKKIDGQKALSDALKAMTRVSDDD